VGTLEARTGTPGYWDVRGLGIGVEGWTGNTALEVGKVGRTFGEGTIARWVPWKADLQSGWRQTCARHCTIPPDHHPQVSPVPALLSNPEYPYPGLSGISLRLKDRLRTRPPQSTLKTHQCNHPLPSFPDDSV